MSTPSGDARAAEECVAVACLALPDEAQVERLTCSSPKHAPDLLARVQGSGAGRLLLLGHLDTVVAHDGHRPLRREEGGEKLRGSGTIDMKGGVVLALEVLRALAERPEGFAEVALLLVNDEEWRTAPFAHAARFRGWEGCLCFEAGERSDGDEAVVVRRKAAGAVEVTAVGRAAHAGSAPDLGRNALLALAAIAKRLTGLHDPAGPDRRTVVPSVMRAGEALNVVPPTGELLVDVRADRLEAFAPVLDAVPPELDGVRLAARQIRSWPGMDTKAVMAPALAGAASRAGRPIVAAERGGASDASHFASAIERTVDGLGPRGGGAHHPDEFVRRNSVRPRMEVALALAAELLSL